MATMRHTKDSIHAIAMLGNHLPRRCGIATFTTDLIDAIAAARPDITATVVAMNDVGAKHLYPPRVEHEIAVGDIEAYREAADFLSASGADVLSVQHEFGIFGGRAGAHLLELLRHVRMPIVTTLHTILASPDGDQRSVMTALLGLSERVVVMSRDGARLLREVYGVKDGKVEVIPHGIPAMPARRSKRAPAVHGRPVILTFGLLSPDKGLEYVIDAMPEILGRHPTAVYVVLGATHPHVKEQHGEQYRQMLQLRAERLGVGGNVVFHNRFVSHDELVEFLMAADLYVTPYLKEAQSTSGTLAYAVGIGKAVVSTPYRYARELLDGGRGALVPWRDSAAIAREIVDLFDNTSRRVEMERRAAEFGRAMSWPIVANRYVACFEAARIAYEARALATSLTVTPQRRPDLPPIDLTHVRLLTDDTGLLQHATFDVPCYRDGYCLDDNTRALILLTHVEAAGTEAQTTIRALSTRYLAFIAHALDEETGRFRNFLTYSRHWHDGPGSDDSHGRALWALGVLVGRSSDPGRSGLGLRLFNAALAGALELGSPRAWAYTLLGIDEYVARHPGDDRVESVRAELARRLMQRYEHTQRPEWPWFEDRLTYCNARLPQALMVTAARTGDIAMAAVAQSSLEWLVTQHIAPDDTFAPVGTNGFHVRGERRATYDQQPVEACAMASACLDAHRVTGEPKWLDRAWRAYRWFVGDNVLGAPVYDARTGGCRDGIHADRLNENQGAESTLSFLMALAELRVAAQIPLASAVTRHNGNGHNGNGHNGNGHNGNGHNSQVGAAAPESTP